MENSIKGCSISPAVKPPASGNMTSLPQMILQRQDLAIVVTGTLSCVRGIYKTVAALGRLHQLHYCVLQEEDYAGKGWLDKYAAAINQVLQRQGLGGIIVYAGCLDLLAGVRLDQVRPLLDNPAHIPVELLFRGPVAAAARKPKDVLTELLAKIPPTDGVLDSNGFVLPPPLPDFAGVGAMLEKSSSGNILLDIGGCSACLAPGRNSFSHLKKTSFDGYAGLKKYREDLDTALLSALQQENTSRCVLMETPVVKKAGLDTDWLQKQLAAKQLTSLLLPTSGYHSSVEGVASALLQLGKQAALLCHGQRPQPAPNLIGVLGADSGQSACRAKIHHGLEHLLQDGYEAIFPEDLLWEGLERLATVRLNWVVSSAAIPLAQYMKQKFGIPYFAAIPIGARAMLLWRNQINKIMNSNDAQLLDIPPVAPALPTQQKILIVGDPVLTAGIKRYYYTTEGCRSLQRAVYTPLPSLAKFTTTVTAAEAACGLQDSGLVMDEAPLQLCSTQEWQELAAQYDIIICDRLMQLALGDRVKPQRWINIPDGIFSTGLAEEPDYTIFGKKGAAWLSGCSPT